MTALEKIKFDVIGLAETHTKRAQRLRWKEGRLRGAEVHVGMCDAGRNNSTIGGVGFIVSKSMTHCIHSIDLQSSRIGVLKLKVPGQRAPLKIVQVYAPHSGYSADEHEQFYADLELKLSEPACRTIVLGDFNARIGSPERDEHFIGPSIAEARNEAGQRMATFAEAQQLYVMNGFFNKPIQKRWTWQSADGVTRSEIDYVMCDERLTVRNVGVLSRFEARSDHKIVRATLMLDLPRLKKNRALNAREKVPTTISEDLLKSKIEVTDWSRGHDERRVNARYEELEQKLLECVKAAEVRRVSNSESRISDETKALMRQLQAAKQNGENAERCRELSREVRKMLRADCGEYKNTRLIKAAEARESLKKCKRKMAQSQLITGALQDADGELCTERQKVEEICSRFYSSLFESKVRVPKMRPADTEAREASLEVTAAEIEFALKKFKNGKAPGPDGITTEMLKAAGVTLWNKRTPEDQAHPAEMEGVANSADLQERRPGRP